MRILLWAGIAVVALVIVAAGTAYVLVQRGALIGPAENALSAALGRDVTIGGLDVDIGRVIDVRVRALRIANPDWAEAADAARFDDIALSVRAWPLLRGDVQIPDAHASGGQVEVEIAADGRLNWASAETAGDVVAPEERAEFPAIANLELAKTKLHVVDRQRGLTVDADISAAVTPENPEITADASGTMNGKPLKLTFVGGAPRTLRDADVPYPVDLTITHGATEAKVAGTVDEPFDTADFAIELTLSGPSLADILPELDLPLPPTPPYRLAGALSRAGDIWQFRNFDGVVGDSDLAGTVAVDLSGDKPRIEGALTSRQLDFDDLAGFIGAAPDSDKAAEPEARDGVFPDVPLDDERLHTANLKVTLTAAQVIAPNLPIDALSGTFDLADGRLLVRPLELTTRNGGRIAGEIALNARQDVPSADIDMTLANVDLRPFFENTPFIQEMGGSFSGRIYLIGVGDSLAAMMAVANGGASLGMRDGRISALLVEAAGLDVAEALLVAVTEDSPLPVRCARADLDVEDGVIQLRQVVVDTSDSTLIAQGSANLASETLDVQVEARAKDFSLLDVAAPVRVSGAWRDPTISIGGLDPLPFLEMGDQEDVNCDALLADVAERAPKTR
ncbi:MAG: AsmA family protein [Alphaproteobacteria bacterium]